MLKKREFSMAVLLVAVMACILAGCSDGSSSGVDSNVIASKYRCTTTGMLNANFDTDGDGVITLIEILNAAFMPAEIGPTSIKYVGTDNDSIIGLKTSGGFSVPGFSWSYLYKGSERIGFVMSTGLTENSVSFFLGAKVCSVVFDKINLPAFLAGTLPTTTGMSETYCGAGGTFSGLFGD